MKFRVLYEVKLPYNLFKKEKEKKTRMWKRDKRMCSSFMPARGGAMYVCDPSSYQVPGYKWLEGGGSF